MAKLARISYAPPRTIDIETDAVSGSINNALLHMEHSMQLGAFSVSLAVKDIQASKNFYENFGFTPVMGPDA